MASAGTALILVVDDDKHISKLLEEVLQEEGYTIQMAHTLFNAQGLLQRTPPDLIVLDRHLPDGDGVDLCLQLKKEERTKNIPILFLTAKKEVPERVLGLRAGGDDYLTKPFSPQELTARVKAILRRSMIPVAGKALLEAGPVRLDMEARKAYFNNKELELWPKEYDLLVTFLERRNRVLTRDFLMQHVWGSGKEAELTSNVVDVTIGNLRKKLSHFGDSITAVRGYGYRFDYEETNKKSK
ncbi:MAG: response regulator transcription factor [Elusimicrobia bacterium]|nr:response regulator transcription factor [Elusimicrobiota bacterium]